jgi:hypothetical protein
MTSKPLLYIQREGGEAGLYDLVQLAGLMRRKIISGETQTRLEGEDAWKPFSWQSQFSVVREMSADAVSMRIDELDAAAADRDRPPIPLPSRETLVRLGGMMAGCLCAGIGAFCLARLDGTVGFVLLVAGLAATAVAQCLIFARILDEQFLTLLGIFFVPGGDIYYFVTRFWQYYKLFCLKYGGACVAIGAALGLGQNL